MHGEGLLAAVGHALETKCVCQRISISFDCVLLLLSSSTCTR